jgi:glycerol-3-phosphate dehydrogenase (NAD(P)+)
MGAGSWGTAFSLLCADAGGQVHLWARSPAVADEINVARRNHAYLGDVVLPESITATSDPEQAITGAEIVVLAIPSLALRRCLDQWKALMPPQALFVSLVKGIEVETRMRASQIVASVLGVPGSHIIAVSGPNLAGECAARLPAATVAACPDLSNAERVQRISHTRSFRVYTNPDVVGVEIGGAVKNVIAIAAGIAHGLGAGDNTKAMLVTRGLAEMTRLGVAMGGNPITFSGLAGMGDLVATCMSTQSRNHHVGTRIARGESLEEIVHSMNMVAEGVKTSRAILALAHEFGAEMPIVEHVVKVVHEGVGPADVVESLMGREPKAEFHGLPEAEPTNTPEAEPANTPEAEPINTPEAEPANTPEAEPANTPEAEPANTPEAEPANTPEAEPTSIEEAG